MVERPAPSAQGRGRTTQGKIRKATIGARDSKKKAEEGNKQRTSINNTKEEEREEERWRCGEGR